MICGTSLDSGGPMSVSPLSNSAANAPQSASEYVRSILELLGDRDPLDILARLADDLREETAGLNEDKFRRPEAPGKWSIFEVLRHLADTEIAIGWRLRMVIAQDQPSIVGFDQDAWSVHLGALYPDVRTMIEQIAFLRERHVTLLRSLTPTQWERVGHHSERGPESLSLMARLYAGHDLTHLRQIARIRAALGKPTRG
jgi:hypothetical protein